MAGGRIAAKFRELRGRNEAALIPFIVAGDPTLAATSRLVLELERCGADIIELGVPFSDPMADGPANQRALARGLGSGASLPAILNLVAELRKETAIPLILFGYFNPFLHYGCEQLAADASRAGVDGILAVDLPLEEVGELASAARQHSLDIIRLLAPTTPLERARKIARAGSGFLYYVSVTGVTGARREMPTDLADRVTELKSVTELPVGVGFGVSTPEQAGRVASFADAVVVGSAITLLVEQHATAPEVAVGELVSAMKNTMRAARGSSEAAEAR
ncbi:MAG TPA: tryptophan synthase subunit alpha [Candidatus Binataceae bacterium]|nr:tryptophan synthase subunit alpha [Candidatus Binataceae bacterium]